MIDISKLQISNYRTRKHWDFGNKILYELCKDNPQHDKDEVILTKVLFIGRVYAAAIERRKNKKQDDIGNDNFYIDKVAPTFRNSQLDKRLSQLKPLKKLTAENLQQVLETHFYLLTTLSKITDMEKRSFCSKYLHFHLPELFFIYDSRAVSALRQFISRVPKELYSITKLKTVDEEYAKFVCKCFALKSNFENVHKTTLSNRQLDNLLIEIANKKSK